ncbi:uncharacterized protein LOC110631778 isoform X2 [Hevea brasiliensis]|uniref:uncharacterized protein LOC110631778 isoform X2 n=1 Tax=Hevea brasiliensis TaxID=3981 RepID=UPI0025CFA084|nr:uncharacterized protein LOC110631778 isoform X2 [Hevea brasiliensis]
MRQTFSFIDFKEHGGNGMIPADRFMHEVAFKVWKDPRIWSIGCQSAKEIWDKLELTYEGTDVVKESKANLLIRDYELFEMKAGESIVDMSTRFADLVNLLKALGKKFEEAELVKKILRSLSKSWEAKTTVIQDTKDLKTFTYDELIGSLIAHEMVYKKDEVENE